MPSSTMQAYLNIKTTSSILRRNMMRKHVGEKPHNSKQYYYTSTTFSDALPIHMMTHTGEKPHKFDQCITLLHKYVKYRNTRRNILPKRHTNVTSASLAYTHQVLRYK